MSGGGTPAGVALDPATGALRGIPTSFGTFPFALSVSDASGQTATVNATITVIRALDVRTTRLRPAKVGAAYSATLRTVGGQAPVRFALTGGKLPAGLKLNAKTGVVSGKAKKERRLPLPRHRHGRARPALIRAHHASRSPLDSSAEFGAGRRVGRASARWWECRPDGLALPLDFRPRSKRGDPGDVGNDAMANVTVRGRVETSLLARAAANGCVGIGRTVVVRRQAHQDDQHSTALVEVAAVSGSGADPTSTAATRRPPSVPRTTLRAVLPLAQAKPCYLAGYSKLIRT